MAGNRTERQVQLYVSMARAGGADDETAERRLAFLVANDAASDASSRPVPALVEAYRRVRSDADDTSGADHG